MATARGRAAAAAPSGRPRSCLARLRWVEEHELGIVGEPEDRAERELDGLQLVRSAHLNGQGRQTRRVGSRPQRPSDSLIGLPRWSAFVRGPLQPRGADRCRRTAAHLQLAHGALMAYCENRLAVRILTLDGLAQIDRLCRSEAPLPTTPRHDSLCGLIAKQRTTARCVRQDCSNVHKGSRWHVD